ncbi:MAG: primosomal protein N' [Candidatus Saccharimonadales bacterium]
MYFYEVLPSSGQFHGKAPLTYSYEAQLEVGSVVVVPLRNQDVVGVVVGSVPAPDFKTKSIVKVVLTEVIPEAILSTLDWLRHYYPAPLGTLAQLILPSSLLRKKELAQVETPVGNPQPTAMPPLTEQQKTALTEIERSPSHSFLLHGDTGSGKTRLYLELAQQTLAAGQSVLLLTPEIGLTPQLEQRVRSSLGAPVVIMHSNLTPAQRRQVWLQIIKSQQPMVVIGPRSALFTPLRQLGLIVIDEAHDAAYKQDQAPHYQTARVAARLAAAHQAKLVLGTATPLISEYALMEAKKVPIVRLEGHPAGEASEKQITVVNLRDRQQFPAQPHLSQPLLKQIRRALDEHQQSLVFLNRRGTARLVLCQACGWQALCSNCDLPLTYHGDKHQLRCHTCGITQSVPSACPVCASTDILFKSIGTKSLADEIQAAFPEARIKRFDTDSQKSDRLENQFKEIAGGDVDILVGTQILAKGLDLPNLTVVGVVVADTSLYFPDYTADEQTFQLLTQVMGRVGRGHKTGHIVIQSYSPDSPAIEAAAQQDWQAFYKQQLAERRQYDFPPFYHLLKLTVGRASQKTAEMAAQKLHDELRKSGLKIKVSQPAPSFYQKIGGKHHWQLIVRAKDRSQLIEVIERLPSGWSFDIDPLNLL